MEPLNTGRFMEWVLKIVGLVVAMGAIFTLFSYQSTRRIARSAETNVPASGSFITVNGRKLHYLDRGDGPVLLFVHGLGGNLHNFDWPLWSYLPDGYRLIAADRAGAGYSTGGAPHSGLIRDHAADLVALLDALEIDKAMVVGHSLGGAIALAMAVLYPERVAGLALISPLTKFKAEVPKGMEGLNIRSPLMRSFVSRTFAVPASVRATERTMEYVFGPQQPPAGYAVEGGAMIGLRPSHFYATSTDFVAVEKDLPQLETRWSEIEVPVGVLFGTEDRLVDYRANGEALRDKLPALKLDLLEGVGHMPQYARPRETADFIGEMARLSFD